MFKTQMARVALATILLASATAAHAAAPPCTPEASPSGTYPAGVRITKADHIPASSAVPNASSPSALPAYYRMSGIINERRGVNGKTYGIGFEVALPDDWNGRLLFQAGGGLNGVINPPIGEQVSGGRPALARGFAVVSTDSGHKGVGGFDPSFKADQQAALDFAHFSVGTTTLAAKAIVRSHYGRAAKRSYLIGCSTGGREAMLASQRYPDLFDGIVAGAPAMRTEVSNIAAANITAIFNRAAAKDAAGRPTALFSQADRSLILKSILADCDGQDGLKDGVIAKAGACMFRPARIACIGGKTVDCLTAVQVQALVAAFTPAKDAAGAQIYPAFP
ncbi:tannase/feruloyl esterase family alpha/beta hydrolase [Sphingomonas sp. BAUL-RG-20F-R05-02]|uniref:tannase/feruloyl esterase family alpha/beta hydrolase n=1 Tax=Sphingomonas sp. BAUL-RG-20F-R05-02 TaxID=2914830 RepID=UPI001F59B8BE|nr:tannase/feruloyl esterase family alpha/beta hydrolase [Sphingomonas sp. BAUL-RG-20F-R05-02]